MNTKRWGLILLVCGGFILTSCGGDSTVGMTAEETTEEIVTVEETTTSIFDELPQVDMEGKAFNFYVKGEELSAYWCSHEIYAAELNAETLNDAVFNRNKAVEQQYNLLITETRGKTNMVKTINTSVMAGDTDYDIVMPSITDGAELAIAGLFINFNEMPYIDFSQPWWNSEIIHDMKIGSRIYFAISDIQMLDKDAARNVLFNKKLFDEYKLDSPYQYVLDGKWTIDKMGELSKNFAHDVNGDGLMDERDAYGINSEAANVKYLMSAMGAKFAETDSDGNIKATLLSGHGVDAFDKLCSVLYDTEAVFSVGQTKTSIKYEDIWEIPKEMFGGNRALFLMQDFDYLPMLRSMEADFGIIPSPKFNEEQEKYYTPIYSNGVSCICIPMTNTMLENTGIMLEALSAVSSTTLKPAYYETCLKGKYSRDTESETMLDIIFDNRVFDIGLIYSIGEMESMVNSLADDYRTDLTSLYAKNENKINDDIAKITKAFSEIS